MFTAQALEKALRASLVPGEHQQHIPLLAALLADAANKDLTRDEVIARIIGHPGLIDVLVALAGTTPIEIDGQALTFSQSGENQDVHLVNLVGGKIVQTTKLISIVGDRNLYIENFSGGTLIGGDVNVHIYPPSAPPDPKTLQEANDLLASMPLDQLPPYKPLPFGSRILRKRYASFVGRREELLALARYFRGEEYTQKSQPIAITGEGNHDEVIASTGIGGLGKTQLANEFVYLYGPYFKGGVFWLNFATSVIAQAEVADCGRYTSLRADMPPNFSQLETDIQAKYVRQAWESPIPRLLVFDNCEDEQLLNDWQPSYGGCRVLVTSRRAEWSQYLNVRPLPLRTLKREESILLLRNFCQHLPPEDDHILGAIAAELGDLPLALHLAGCYLRAMRRDIQPAEYLARLRSPPISILKDISLLTGDISPTDHIQHVANTFALSYEQLHADQPRDEAARALLSRASQFAPGELIPRSLLRQTLRPDASSYTVREQIGTYFQRLVELGLIEEEVMLGQEEEQEALRLHRLLAQFVLDVTESTAHLQARKAVEECIMYLLSDRQAKGYEESLIRLRAHLYHITEKAFKQASTNEDYFEAATLFALADPHFLRWGDSQQIYERNQQLQQHVTDPRIRAFTLVHLGNAALKLGDYALAEQSYMGALQLAEAGRLRPGEKETLFGLLGGLYMKTGRMTEATNLYMQAIHSARHYSDANLEAKWLLNLGLLFFEQGEINKAIECFTDSLNLTQDSEHFISPEVGPQNRMNLGICLHLLGKFEAASEHIHAALQFAQQSGAKEFEIACWINLGEIAIDLADDNEAQRCLEKALEVCHLSEFAEERAQALHSQAELLTDLGQYQQALMLVRECHELGRRFQSALLTSESAITQARAYLLLGEPADARAAALSALEHSTVRTKYQATVLLGIAELLLGHPQMAVYAFETAMQETRALLDKASHYYKALYFQFLALLGLACCKQESISSTTGVAYEKTRAITIAAGMTRRIEGLARLLHANG